MRGTALPEEVVQRTAAAAAVELAARTDPSPRAQQGRLEMVGTKMAAKMQVRKERENVERGEAVRRSSSIRES